MVSRCTEGDVCVRRRTTFSISFSKYEVRCALQVTDSEHTWILHDEKTTLNSTVPRYAATDVQEIELFQSE